MAEETNVQSTETTPDTGGGATYTQTQVDDMVRQATEGMPSAEELAAFRAWQDSRQSDEDRIGTVTRERDQARNDLAAAQEKIQQFEREKLLSAKGVPADDLDYYAFKIGKLVTKDKTFEQAADEYLREHKPRGSDGVRVDLGAGLSGNKGDKTPNDEMNALIRGALK